MAGKLQKEIGKSGPFTSLEEEAMLNLLRTADRMSGPIEPVMKGKELTLAQYNVLRILPGSFPPARHFVSGDCAADDYAGCGFDAAGGSIGKARFGGARERGAKDRRVVRVAITASGLELVAELDAPVAQANHKALGHMGAEKLRELIDLL